MNEKWETKRLISWNEFIEKFNPIDAQYIDGYNINYGSYVWFINSAMLQFFGEKIKVKRYYGSNKEHYTHEGNWLWHELWFEEEFEPIEFLTEEEMMIE